MKRLRSLLIDDEPNARMRLRRLLKDEEHVEVIGEAKDGLEAVAEIERLKPDLVFLDVQMPGLDGFGTLKALSPELPLPLIIFVTGFHEHAMAAFDANAIAYLLKPIEPERLREMIERAWRLLHFAEDRAQAVNEVHQFTASVPPNFRQIVARKLDRFLLLDPADILYFYMDHGIVRARTSDDNVWVNYQLSDLEQGLNEFNFFRAHRASLVNLRRVKEIRPSPRSAFLLIMDDPTRTQIEVSERQARVLRSIIPGL
ncbi:MAG TPA: LytTR family DNA-binding domain-containing protein [Chthoniobacterales bacterium]|jgi:DNA-binding LytR/AlgR family response regulator|nr:LytTR family DNA-binding domain-containing protein [Chthoniobacterales bacterium]